MAADSVGSIPNPSHSSNQASNRRKAMQDLASALKSGDVPQVPAAYDKPGNLSSDSPLARIGVALKSGDIKSAQTDMEAMQKNHKGHHHAQNAAPSTASTSAPANVTSTPGSVIHETA
ncbi:hypothetical protein [Laribacter hongkongensis]|uniref:Uncharacterized protein n=1 Tax=Laribacter hongkongensis TaxID=168471 RepID=A0A248LMH2_9NEIS|nr:hypothetical protein [Laribacter hongkongensis]ASJ25363.1 hypothetical protein LHGZ1_2532 [Laribacter hongkongensis]MCG9041907.1 hypothetical protein [Laribacter hongkongensis]MCG9068781.1 hypothetical protein [Laribacter hongkongensis]MCG9088639.1 hypothetical protein [Laribacter hongkongensis]MCG9110486.1 hypothetical protein [Laribacter hongkongensis]